MVLGAIGPARPLARCPARPPTGGDAAPLLDVDMDALRRPAVGARGRGKVDPGSDAHDLLMQLYGGMNKGERNRIKVRVRSAMAAQAQHEGRFLGGRPPYGHELVDAGPHPNPSKAYMVSGSVALSVILPPLPSSSASSPSTSGGSGIGAIAEGLNRDHIPSPSGHDPARNRHRASANGAWARALRGRSFRTRAAPAARCGTANAAPKNCSTSTTWRQATGPR